MTVVAVLADPPRPGLVLSELAETSPLTEAEAAELYAALLKDTVSAIERSGGELLVNYRSEEMLPDEYAGTGDADAEAEVRAVVADALEEPSGARYEVQVGSSFSARAGNTATHLLREEGVQSVAVVRGTAPFLLRSTVDSAAMKLRTNPVVLGPSAEGRTYYAGFSEPIDYAGAFETPEVETLVARANEAGSDVGFLPMQPSVERGSDLLSVVPMVRARWQADRIVPAHTAAFVVDHGLRVAAEDGTPTLRRE
ncbi:Uncharacterized conserved protein, glycosyltransferase A (GT-A) superfamily, DUF2064 family [Halopelagius inordinatus]|uniref:Uncharacterized conserved protein, glycosyltransferase A (GT-A) superfamily, DUF2064 family n=1 Tax=Halopelagius inordinatus TaxID=553467 RepID=A0A1I2RFJ9_9EURY|nr:hypothetical protein [Halopelagius inordinatus]SFG36556.1 Uncharacterized conserved protein, glycosyltransferase A (GT-A) superfamily, DUF2064 family [Halopelagius inordinatus]